VRTIVAYSFVAALSLTACTASGSSTPPPVASPVAAIDSEVPVEAGTGLGGYGDRLRLVTLGDGYTAGTSTPVPGRDSWPAQLVQMMAHSDVRLRPVANLALSGQSSGDVRESQLPQVESLKPDVVTVQVGANDIFSSIELEQYEENMAVILDGLLDFLPPDRIFVITTPDHELTVRGKQRAEQLRDPTEVADFNAVLTEVADERGITVVDIAPVYELVEEDPSLVLDGGPDPTARQYAGWVQVIGQQMRQALVSPVP
jgi:lysophospholipase L1-like esterase